MKQQHKDEMKRVLDASIAGGALRGRAVILFGHCNATMEMAGFLLGRGIPPVAILDNNPSKHGISQGGIPVVAPQEIRKYNASDSIVLIAARFYAEMAAQLGRLGYDGEVLRVVEYDSFSEYSLSDETFGRRVERMRRGANTLEQIRGKYPSQHMVVCPNNALGDVYWAMAFLPAYLGKRGIYETALITVGDGCRQVAEMFGEGDIVSVAQAEMDELVQAIVFAREENCIIAHHDRPYTDSIIKLLDRRFLSFIDYYRCAVYGLGRDAAPTEPSNFAAFENKGRIAKGSSVILSPYAKSVVGIPAGYWEGVAAGYARRGYEVYTCAADGELPIGGTEPLSLPISQIKAAAEYAGAFVGIRNGLCDVLFTADCKKTVVFPDSYYSTTPHKVEDFFALPGWEKIVYFCEKKRVRRCFPSVFLDFS